MLLLDIEKVGVVRVRFTEADISKFGKQKIKREGHFFSKDVWYDVDMMCEVGLADAVGVLQFAVKCRGELCGTASFLFPHE